MLVFEKRGIRRVNPIFFEISIFHISVFLGQDVTTPWAYTTHWVDLPSPTFSLCHFNCAILNQDDSQCE